MFLGNTFEKSVKFHIPVNCLSLFCFAFDRFLTQAEIPQTADLSEHLYGSYAMTSEFSSSQMLMATLMGRFRLMSLQGHDHTPLGSAKAQGVLVLLLMAPAFERSREFLIDKLWSDRQPEQGARSLKTELYNIRKALGPHRDLLRSDNGMVGLVPGAIGRDLDAPGFEAPQDVEFCEGLQIRDPQFSDWLNSQRRTLADSGASHKPLISLMSQQSTALFHDAMLQGGFQQTLEDWCAEELVVSVGRGQAADDSLAQPAGYVLEQMVQQSEIGVGALMSMVRQRDRKMIWHRTDKLEADPGAFLLDEQTHRVINSSVDRTLEALTTRDRRAPEARYLQRGLVGAIQLIFRNRDDDIHIARQRLQETFDQDGKGAYLAWLAFSLTFLKGEHNRSEEDLRDEAEALVHRALELDGQNAVVLALASYVYTYLLGNALSGLELADRAIELNRSNPLAWAFRGTAFYTMGEYEKAFAATRYARAVAGDGPYRYAIETYFCIASTLSNRIDDAILAGEAALRLKPDFKASLRYLAVLYAHKKDEAKLARVMRGLRKSEPDFSFQKMLEQRNYPSEIIRTAPILNT
jgi:tetratricopeptide (TPR) repeat protein